MSTYDTNITAPGGAESRILFALSCRCGTRWMYEGPRSGLHPAIQAFHDEHSHPDPGHSPPKPFVPDTPSTDGSG